jgi:flagellar hook-length control protein FliK
MSEFNLDHLLQVTAPRADWSGATSARGRDEQPGFDDHLFQASATTAPPEPVRASEDRRPETAATAHASLSDDVPAGNDNREVEEAATDVEPNSSAIAVEGDGASKGDNAAVETTAPTEPTEESADGVSDESQPEGDGESDEADPSNADDTNTVVLVTATVSPEEIVVDKADHVTDNDRGESSTRTSAEGDSPGRRHDSKSTKAAGPEAVPNTDNSQGTKPVRPDGTPEMLSNAHEAEVHEPPANNDTLQRLAASSEAPHIEAAKVAAAEARDQQNGSVRRGRPAVPEGEPASPLPTQEQAEAQAEQTSTESTEKQPLSGEDKPHTREGAFRAEARTDPPAANPKNTVVAATQVAVVEPAGETTKTDTADESLRPVGAAASARADALLPPLVKLQRAGGMVARGQRTAEGEELTRVDTARFVGRVARAFHTAQERGGTLQLRLSPPELGAMRIELLVKDGVLTASLETETPAARRVLLDNLPSLRDRLAEQNIRIEKFDVDVRRDGSGGQQQPAPQQRDQQSSQWTPQRNQPQSAKNAPVAPPMAPVPGAPITDTQINLFA